MRRPRPTDLARAAAWQAPHSDPPDEKRRPGEGAAAPIVHHDNRADDTPEHHNAQGARGGAA